MNIRGLLAVPLAVLFVVACGEDEPDAVTSTSPPTTEAAGTASTAPATSADGSTTTSSAASGEPIELDGREFVSTEVVGYELVPDSQIRLSFEGDQLGAAGGCNQLSGAWALDGDVLVVDAMASTMMACEPAALMDQDTWLSSFLTSEPVVTVEGDELTLTAGASSITLVDAEVAEPDQSLEGPTWTLESIRTPSAVTSLAAPPATLTFSAGQVAVDTGCNTGSGSYTATETEITFSPIALTRRGCEPLAAEQEAGVVAVLDGTVAYEIDSDQLTLTKGDRGLIYRAG